MGSVQALIKRAAELRDVGHTHRAADMYQRVILEAETDAVREMAFAAIANLSAQSTRQQQQLNSKARAAAIRKAARAKAREQATSRMFTTGGAQ